MSSLVLESNHNGYGGDDPTNMNVPSCWISYSIQVCKQEGCIMNWTGLEDTKHDEQFFFTNSVSGFTFAEEGMC